MLDLLLINNNGRMHRSDAEAGANPLFKKKGRIDVHVSFPCWNSWFKDPLRWWKLFALHWLDQLTSACRERLLLEGIFLEHCTLSVGIYHIGKRWDLEILS